jgi:2-dehydro-3-deoxygalactonokinase
MTPFLAVDWGTTNLRGWRIGREGDAEAEVELPLGVSRLAGQTTAECFAKAVRPALGGEGLPALLCGMVGSNLGWRTAPYLPCPAQARDLLQHLVTVEDVPAPVRIVPGLSCKGLGGLPDVMRGEETHIIGWLALDLARQKGSHLICHPGTHSKWVRIIGGSITHFATAMTGELFDVLRKASVIGMGSVDNDIPEFGEGLKAAGDGGALSVRLFSTRARVVTGEADRNRAPSFLSGLLIGSEIAALVRMMDVQEGETIHIVGAPRLAELYGIGVRRSGRDTSIEDGEKTVLSGLKLLVELGALNDA